MVKKKPPVRHTVRAHTRKGRPVRSFERGKGSRPIHWPRKVRRLKPKVVIEKEGIPRTIVVFARESSNYGDFVQRIRDHFYKPSRLAKDVEVGQYVIFTPPEGVAAGLYHREPWYGTKGTKQYSGSSIMGEVIKINPKTVRIKKTFSQDAWDYGHEYIVPKTAKATRDLTQLLGKDDQWLENVFETARGG